MGNAASSHADMTVVGLKETSEDQLSVTNNSATSSSASSSSSSASAISADDDFYDCPQCPLENPPIANHVKSTGSSINNQTRRQHAMHTPPTIANKSSSASVDECFRLPFFFRKQHNLIRVLHQDQSNDDDDDGDVMFQSGEQNQQPNTCWNTSGRQRHQRKSSLSTRGDETDSNFADSLEFDNNDQDEDLSSDDEDYSCSPAYLYRKSKTAAMTTSTTSDERRSYYCYPSAATGGSITASTSSSSLSRCRSAMTNSASGLSPLFLDETRSSDWEYTQEELDMLDGDERTEASDMKPPRKYWIVTTAALPWMTGTAVNPLLRAAYLSQRNRQLMQQQQKQVAEESDETQAGSTATTCSTVTLVLPWLEYPEDREKLYGPKWAAHDKTCADQEAYIREWLATSAHLPLEAADPSEGGISIQWYPARYHASLSSIFALGDLCEMIPTDNDGTDSVMSSKKQNKSDMIIILEEPEHVNFYRAPGRESWRDHFGHVIGVVHTNYKAYARNHYSGIVTGPLVGALSSLMVRAYCDKVVKLSPVLQTYAPGKEVISNVHGIRQEFFRVPMPSSRPKVQCYFIGKLLWAKGLDKLLDLEARYRKTTGQYFSIDIIGSGPEQTEIERSFLGRQQNRSVHQTSTPSTGKESSAMSHWRYFRQPIPARFLGRKDHAAIGSQYTIFVNPSITEVLCTTTAEAVAMGKWVIIPRHASNEFFLQFPNCLQYKHKGEFVELLQYALANPVSHVIQGSHNHNRQGLEDRSHLYTALTWEAATERLIDTAYLSKRDERRRDRLTLHKEDKSIQEWHYTLGNGKSGDVLRRVLGGGPVAEQSTYKKLSPSSSSSTLSASASSRSLISAI